MKNGDWCKALGDSCSRCKRTDVEFARRNYACRSCTSSKNKANHRSRAESNRARSKARYDAQKGSMTPAEFKRANRAMQLWTKYRLTPEDYENLLLAQGSVCKICKSPDWGTRDGTPCVDHDHAMSFPRSHGRKQKDKYPVGHVVGTRDGAEQIRVRRASVRGLLCSPCNTMLGGARDRVDLLELGVSYLLEHRERSK